MIQRKRSTGISEAMASEIPGNKPRGPVWKMVGSSASMRN